MSEVTSNTKMKAYRFPIELTEELKDAAWLARKSETKFVIEAVREKLERDAIEAKPQK